MLFPLSPRLKNQEISFYTYGLLPFSSQKQNKQKNKQEEGKVEAKLREWQLHLS